MVVLGQLRVGAIAVGRVLRGLAVYIRYNGIYYYKLMLILYHIWNMMCVYIYIYIFVEREIDR